MARNDETAPPPLDLSLDPGFDLALDLDGAVRWAKAVGHPARLRMLAMLQGGELCVCQLTAALGLATSTVSGHLADLRRAGLVEEEKEGRWVRYRLTRAEPEASLVGRVLDLVAEDRTVRDDRRLAAELRRRSPEVLCEAGLDLAALGLGAGGRAASSGRSAS
jgi:DNA-binding transcriptional ArsR family regulator